MCKFGEFFSRCHWIKPQKAITLCHTIIYILWYRGIVFWRLIQRHLKRVSPICTSICQNFWKIPDANNVCNKDLVIIPLGKLFPIISNIVYLSLVRFKIGFFYLYLSSNSTLPGRIKILFVWPLNFPKVPNLSTVSFLQLPVV